MFTGYWLRHFTGHMCSETSSSLSSKTGESMKIANSQCMHYMKWVIMKQFLMLTITCKNIHIKSEKEDSTVTVHHFKLNISLTLPHLVYQHCLFS